MFLTIREKLGNSKVILIRQLSMDPVRYCWENVSSGIKKST